MGYNRTLGEIGSVRDQVLERQEHTLHASKIEILYEKTDTQKHKIVATFDAREPYTTQVQDLDGNTLNIPDIEASNEYPLNLYGWNELELLGEDPRSQRDNLDRFIKALTLLKNGRSRYYLELENNANACDQQLLELDKFFDTTQAISEFIRLKDYEAGFDKLNTDEMEETFKQFDKVNHKLLFVSKLKDKITDSLNNLENILSLDIEDFLVQQQHELEWCKELVEDRLDFKEYNDLIAKYKTDLEGKLNGYLTIINETVKGLSLELSKITKSINESVGDEKSISGDLRNNAKKRVDDARKYYDLYKKELAVFESLLEERKKIIENICKSNERIFATRNREIGSIAAKIQIVEDDSFKVNLKLEQESDRLYLLNSLRDNTVELKYEGQYKRRKIPELLADKLTPFALSKALFNKDKSALLNSMTIKEGEVTQDFEIDDEYAEKLITSNCPFEDISGLDVKRYIRGKMKVLFKIEEIKFDDNFFIVLNDKPIQHCSPGQRCSAMLPIVTLTTDAPIIIDQPEDNLDNRLVSRAVFKILSKLKESRQIILATHNPNILVSGDSEQVVVLTSTGDIEDFGSIDKPSIISNVIELMEGGKEAFEKRRLKYKI
jgi:hypothetical protein